MAVADESDLDRLVLAFLDKFWINRSFISHFFSTLSIFLGIGGRRIEPDAVFPSFPAGLGATQPILPLQRCVPAQLVGSWGLLDDENETDAGCSG